MSVDSGYCRKMIQSIEHELAGDDPRLKLVANAATALLLESLAGMGIDEQDRDRLAAEIRLHIAAGKNNQP